MSNSDGSVGSIPARNSDFHSRVSANALFALVIKILKPTIVTIIARYNLVLSKPFNMPRIVLVN